MPDSAVLLVITLVDGSDAKSEYSRDVEPVEQSRRVPYGSFQTLSKAGSEKARVLSFRNSVNVDGAGTSQEPSPMTSGPWDVKALLVGVTAEPP